MNARIVRWLSWLIVTACLSLSGALVQTSLGGNNDSLSVTVNGLPVRPYILSLHGTPEDPREGDLLYVDYLLLPIGPEREYRFRSTPDDDGRFLLERDGQPPRVVGVRISWDSKEDQKVLVNPLDKLSSDEVAGLWAISLDHYSDAIAEKLKHINAERVCISVMDDAAQGDKRALPILPAKTRYLLVDGSDGINDVSSLRTLTNLWFLAFGSVGIPKLDATLIKNARELRYLDLGGADVENVSELVHSTELRHLQLSYSKGFTDVSFATQLRSLSYLGLGHTEVSDLSPLAGHPSLTRVNADNAPVVKLPQDRLPRLQTLRVMQTKVSDDAVATFAKYHPGCTIYHRWSTALHDALNKANRLRVRSGGTCHRDPASEKTLFDTDNVMDIRAVVDGIQIDEKQSGFHCGCCGEPSLEFYDGERLIETLGFHHSRSLRWPYGWPGDGALTRTSAEYLVHWLADRGVRGPLDEVEKSKTSQKSYQRRFERATAGLSAEAKNALRKDQANGLRTVSENKPSAFLTALRAELPDPIEQVQTLLRILGLSNGSWQVFDGIDRTAVAALQTFESSVLQRATEQALQGTDRLRRRGAARFWMSYKSPLADWQPTDPAQARLTVLAVQQEARYSDLRIEAMNVLPRWYEILPPEEVDRVLVAGLHDPAPEVRRSAMLAAGRMRWTGSVATLMNALEGKPIGQLELAEVPLVESEEVPEGYECIAPGMSDDAVAALALGLMNYRDAIAVILAKESSPAIEVALALLGQPHRLRLEHFQTESANQELQLAAVEAVVRCRGEFGLAFAIEYEQATHWWEPEYVATQLVKMLRNEGAPGLATIEDAKDLKPLRRWFNQFGEHYLERFQK